MLVDVFGWIPSISRAPLRAKAEDNCIGEQRPQGILDIGRGSGLGGGGALPQMLSKYAG